MRGPQITGVRCAIGALVVWGLAAAGCGAVDAKNEPFAGTIVYQDDDGAFVLRLLVPPWTPPISTQGMTVSLVLPADTPLPTDPSVALDEAVYVLIVSPASGSAATLAQALTSSLPAAAMVAQAPVETASRATGVQITWQQMQTDGERYHRDAFVAGPGTSTYHLAFTAKRPIADDAMVGQMITSFVPYR